MDYETTKGDNFRTFPIIPEMDPFDVAERMHVMRLQEKTTYRCLDYFGVLSNTSSIQSESQQHVNVLFRTQLCEWCYRMVDYCNFRRETVDIAMSFLDRFFGGTQTISAAAQVALKDNRQFQLATMTALYMAIKLFEPIEMDTKFLANLTMGQYTPLEICDMERKILHALQWRVNGPTRTTFAQHFLALLPWEIRNNKTLADTIIELTQFQIELAAKDYFFTTRRNSTTALACLLNAVDVIDATESQCIEFFESIVKFSGFNPFSTEVSDAQSRLLENARASPPSPPPPTTSASNTEQSKAKNTFDSDWMDEDDVYDDDGGSSPVCVRTATMQQS